MIRINTIYNTLTSQVNKRYEMMHLFSVVFTRRQTTFQFVTMLVKPLCTIALRIRIPNRSSYSCLLISHLSMSKMTAVILHYIWRQWQETSSLRDVFWNMAPPSTHVTKNDTALFIGPQVCYLCTWSLFCSELYFILTLHFFTV
jgi:hypothetical protein